MSYSLKDKSPSIRKTYASAISNVAKLATDKQLKAFIDHLVFLYQKSEENVESRQTVGVALLEMAHNAPEKVCELKKLSIEQQPTASRFQLQIFNKEILPLIFLGQSDPNEVSCCGSISTKTLR